MKSKKEVEEVKQVQQQQQNQAQQQSQRQEQADNSKNSITVLEPVENWKACHDVKGRFDIKYPSNWLVGLRGPYGYEMLKTCSSSMVLFSTIINPESIGPYSVRIEVIDTAGKGMIYEGSKSLDDYFKNLPEMAKKFPIIREFKISNERAVYIADYPNPRVLVYHNNRVFDISGVNISEQTFNDFISTFKFLN